MAETRFTPGPWKAQWGAIMAIGTTDTYDGPVWGSIARSEDLEARDGDGRAWTAPGSQEANLALIASSPLLYKALEAALPYIETCANGATDNPAERVLADARAALAQARGEPAP